MIRVAFRHLEGLIQIVGFHAPGDPLPATTLVTPWDDGRLARADLERAAPTYVLYREVAAP